MRSILKIILKILAKRVLVRYRPIVIGITGSVGKTMTKEAIYAVLHRNFFVRKTADNNNNEFGVPMTVLGMSPTIAGLAKSFWLAYGPKVRQYPNVLILELAADRPGDIRYLTEMVRPEIAVVSAIGPTPVHVEFYASSEAVAEEKSAILTFARTTVLNYDDPMVRAMRDDRAVMIGFDSAADIWASDTAYYLDQEAIAGLSFKIHHGESFVPVRIPGIFALHQIYALLAAIAVGLRMQMNLVEITHAFERMELPAHRMSVLHGVRGSIILDDTYNASPLSMEGALRTLRDFPSKHKRIAILGDMKELGKYSAEAHQKTGILAHAAADTVITLGELAQDMGGSHVVSIEEAIAKAQTLIQEGDVVLIKGSRSMQMEKIVEALAVSPKKP